MFLALGLVLPFFTGQIPEIGSMLLPMHIPVLFCGLICGWQYGFFIGLVLPPLRFLLFGMPPLFPTGLAMSVEMAIYGLIIGLLYRKFKKNIIGLFLSLIASMIIGRLAWGAVMVVISGAQQSAFTIQLFWARAFASAGPGILLQLVLIPAVMSALSHHNERSADPELLSLQELLKYQLDLYPDAELIDLFKMIYQNEFGSGHLITNPEKSLKFLEEEAASITAFLTDRPFAEPIGNQLCRLHLQVLRSEGLSLQTLYRFFELSALHLRGSKEGFLRKVDLLEKMCRHGLLPFSTSQIKKVLTDWEQAGSGLFRHSESFRSLYSPSYRVVEKQFCDFLSIFCAIDQRADKQTPLRLAIDGRCGAGKTTLAGLLKLVYDCEVISMDSFFLPSSMRTKERLAEPGGNVDYERFLQEVLIPLSTGKTFSYHPYDCAQGTYGTPIVVNPGKLVVVEGSYSLHPTLRDYYDFKVFLSVSPTEQLQRIQIRNANKAERFVSEWIPLEEAYFKAFSVAEGSDFNYNTSTQPQTFLMTNR
jgi:uridine kinase